jgi:hypothetical protein
LADFTKADNGVTSVLYPGFFVKDKNGKSTGRVYTAVHSDGKLITYFHSNNYDTSGTSVGEMYLGQEIHKDGTKKWILTDAASFRNALGLGTNATSSTSYLPLIGGGTITGQLSFKFGHDLTQENNGVTSIGYYGIRMYDKNNYLSAQFLNQVNTNGNNQININLRNRNGSTEYDKSFLITLTKSGVISASLDGTFTAVKLVKSGGTSS